MIFFIGCSNTELVVRGVRSCLSVQQALDSPCRPRPSRLSLEEAGADVNIGTCADTRQYQNKENGCTICTSIRVRDSARNATGRGTQEYTCTTEQVTPDSGHSGPTRPRPPTPRRAAATRTISTERCHGTNCLASTALDSCTRAAARNPPRLRGGTVPRSSVLRCWGEEGG